MELRRRLIFGLKKLRYRWRKIKKEKKRRFFLGLCLFLAGLCLGNHYGMSRGLKHSQKVYEAEKKQLTAQKDETIRTLQESNETIQAQLDARDGGIDTSALPWYLTLVNEEYPMQADYVPELEEVKDGYQVDARIAKPLRKMLKAAKKEGLHIVICSAYRSVDRQTQVFNDSMQERLDRGMDYWEAYQDNALSVAIPGTSEHGLGLAVDLVSNQYTELDEEQAKTDEAKWLKENCYKYGFILRYPLDKTDETGIIFEPWHYRYVGVEDATRIMQSGVTLETYLQTYEAD